MGARRFRALKVHGFGCFKEFEGLDCSVSGFRSRMGRVVLTPPKPPSELLGPSQSIQNHVCSRLVEVSEHPGVCIASLMPKARRPAVPIQETQQAQDPL